MSDAGIRAKYKFREAVAGTEPAVAHSHGVVDSRSTNRRDDAAVVATAEAGVELLVDLNNNEHLHFIATHLLRIAPEVIAPPLPSPSPSPTDARGQVRGRGGTALSLIHI